MKSKLIYLIILLLSAYTSNAQKDSIDIFNMSIEELMNLKVISPTKTKNPIVNAPAAIEVISEIDIKKNNYTSINEAINEVSGIFITTDYVSHNISMRGINSGKQASSRTIKIMIDGQSIAFRPSSESFLGIDNIPIQLVKRIEIMRGPASTLYGSNAFIGIINIITKKGEEIDGVKIKINNINIKNYALNLNSGFELNATDVIIGINHFYIEKDGQSLPFSTEILKNRVEGMYPTSNIFEQTTQNETSSPSSFYLKTNTETKLGVIYTSFFGQIINSSAKFYDDNPIINQTKINLYNSFAKIGLKRNFLKNKLNSNLLIGFRKGAYLPNMQYDYSSNNEIGSIIKPKLSYNSIDIEASINYNFSENTTILLGLDNQNDDYSLFSYDKIDKSTNAIISNYSATGIDNFYNIGLYSQLQTKLFQSFYLTAGIRFDKQNIYGNNLNYRSAIVYNPAKVFSLKLSYGTSYRAPTFLQLFSPDIPYNPYSGSIGNPNLLPEYLKSTEFSLSYFLKNGFSSEIVAYYNSVNNIIVEKKIASLPIPVNENKINGYGFEMTLKYNSKHFSLKSNYSFQESWYVDKLQNYPQTNLYPEQMAFLGINFLLNKFVDLFINTKYTGQYLASTNNIQANLLYGLAQDYYLGNYFLTDIGVNTRNLKYGKKSKEVKFSLKAKNLFNKKYVFPGYNFYDIPAPCRMIWTTINIKI